MLTVSIHGVRLSGHYGLYEEEQVSINEFEIDADISTRDETAFIDYAVVHKIITNEFDHCTAQFGRAEQSLERLAEQIMENIQAVYPDAAGVRLAVRKLHPPMEGPVNYAQVCLERQLPYFP